ncbi:hypothetical protein [Methanogenium cariaci]|nr:hypothetical protein [Methanogenium cariaci]
MRADAGTTVPAAQETDRPPRKTVRPTMHYSSGPTPPSPPFVHSSW